MRRLQTAAWWVTIGAFILGGPVFGALAWRLANELEQERAWSLCSNDLSEQALDVVLAMRVLSGELSHLRSFFEAQPLVTREEFRLYTSEILKSHPAIQAVEWAPRVLDRERQAHERRAAAEGLPGYRITSLSREGRLVTAPPGGVRYPVFYAEPPGPNVSAIGFDLSSEKTRNAALTRALATEEMSLSEPIKLVQDTEGSRAMLAFMPVRTAHAPAAPGESAGMLVLAVRIEEMLGEILDERRSSGMEPMQVEVFDETAGGTLLVGGAAYGAGEGTDYAGRTFEIPLELGGREWKLVGRPARAFVERHLTRWPLALGASVFLFWESAGGLALLLLIRRKDRTLREQARVHEAAIHSLAEGVVVADARGRLVLFNPAAERILGTGKEDVGVEEWSATYGCFYPDARTPFPPEQLPLARALRGEEAQQELFVRNRRVPDGVWIIVSGTPLRSEGGGLEGGVVVFHDITDWKRSSEELLRLSSAVEQTADTVFITNRDGVIEYVNPAFEATTGYSREETIGQTPRILKSGLASPQQYTELWSTILAGGTYRTKIVNRKKSGDLYHAEQTITPVKGSDGSVAYFVAVVKDMTDRFRRQAQEIEMRYASEIQQKLYPTAPPGVEGYDIAGAVFPAEATCGDYFDYVPLPGGGLGLVIGDVCGHGLGPALIMAEARSYLRFLSASLPDAGQVFEVLNDALIPDLEPHNYVSMVLIRLDVGSSRFGYANAGHLSGYLLGRHGEEKAVLDSTGTPLGIFPGQKYENRENLVVEPGDLLVLFTDGITEAQDTSGNFFGTESALRVIRENRNESAARIVERLCGEVRRFAGGAAQQDDITVVICKRVPPA